MQEIIAGMMVGYAAWVVVLRYAPMAFKRNLRRALAKALKRMGMQIGADWLGKEPAQADCSDGCSNCSGCGPKPAATTGTSRNFSIPVTTLKRTAVKIHESR